MTVSLISVVRDLEKPWKVFPQAMKRIRPFVDEMVVLVDDRSTDQSVSIARSLADKVESVTLGGPAAEWAIQRAMDMATGDWCMWLADDELPSRRFLRAIPELIKDTSHAVTVALVWLVGDGKVVNGLDRHAVLWPRSAYQLSEIHSTVRGFPFAHHVGLPYWHFADLAPADERKAKMNAYCGGGAHPQQGIDFYLPHDFTSLLSSRRW